MKHFAKMELEDELSSLNLISTAVTPAETLAGANIHAIHCLATKFIAVEETAQRAPAAPHLPR